MPSKKVNEMIVYTIRNIINKSEYQELRQLILDPTRLTKRIEADIQASIGVHYEQAKSAMMAQAADRQADEDAHEEGVDFQQAFGDDESRKTAAERATELFKMIENNHFDSYEELNAIDQQIKFQREALAVLEERARQREARAEQRAVRAQDRSVNQLHLSDDLRAAFSLNYDVNQDEMFAEFQQQIENEGPNLYSIFVAELKNEEPFNINLSQDEVTALRKTIAIEENYKAALQLLGNLNNQLSEQQQRLPKLQAALQPFTAKQDRVAEQKRQLIAQGDDLRLKNLALNRRNADEEVLMEDAFWEFLYDFVMLTMYALCCVMVAASIMGHPIGLGLLIISTIVLAIDAAGAGWYFAETFDNLFNTLDHLFDSWDLEDEIQNNDDLLEKNAQQIREVEQQFTTQDAVSMGSMSRDIEDSSQRIGVLEEMIKQQLAAIEELHVDGAKLSSMDEVSAPEGAAPSAPAPTADEPPAYVARDSFPTVAYPANRAAFFQPILAEVTLPSENGLSEERVLGHFYPVQG